MDGLIRSRAKEKIIKLCESIIDGLDHGFTAKLNPLNDDSKEILAKIL